ncbi:hypothetical protein L1887_11017 [Cichorium endivia]|nr:hypothetical protein L1887_11017 [Cichorium endivia]
MPCYNGSFHLFDSESKQHKHIESPKGANEELTEVVGVGGFGCMYKSRLDDDLRLAPNKLYSGRPYGIKESQIGGDMALSREGIKNETIDMV